MNLIIIWVDFQKPNIVVFFQFLTGRNQYFINLIGKNHASILRTTYNMIEQDGYITTLVDIFIIFATSNHKIVIF